MSAPPEVLRDLQARLRRAPAPKNAVTRAADWEGVFSAHVHELTRDEVAAAHHHGVLELDPGATRLLALGGPW